MTSNSSCKPDGGAVAPDRLSGAQRLALVAIVAMGLLVRGWNLGEPICWVDEAESCINALTILEHGVPTNEYLGIPLYENTLTNPWPESAEYEFRDSSYSARGYPVYHGWLPMYSIAAAFALAGVAPDQPRDFAHPRLDPQEYRYRTAVARAPALLFSALFMVLVFLCGRSVFGIDAGWAGLVVAASASGLISAGRQARYYSATLALSVAVFFAIALVVKRGRWRDYVLAAVLFGLQFHTHVLATLACVVVFGLTLPWQFRRSRVVPKLALFTVITFALVVPWVVLTGCLENLQHIPRAWPLLDLPGDVFMFMAAFPEYLLLLAIAFVGLGCALVFGGRVPRLTKPVVEHRLAWGLTAAWMGTAIVLFFSFIPAASLFPQRLAMSLQAPAVLMLGVVLASVARVVRGKPASILACLLALGLTHGVARRQVVDYSRRWDYQSLAAVQVLANLPLDSDTRLYASPNGHLILSFYTGLPIQSVVPIRKQFFDSFPGDIVLFEESIEHMRPGDPLSRAGIAAAAAAAGVSLSDAELTDMTDRMSTRIAREDLAERVAVVVPPATSPPGYLRAAIAEQRSEQLSRTRSASQRLLKFPFFRGTVIETIADLRPNFFYRFVHPEQRRGDLLNYANRLRSATAFVNPHQRWVVCHMPAL